MKAWTGEVPDREGWYWGHLTGRGGLRLSEGDAIERQKAIGEFCAHAREDVPYLLSLVARQAQEIQDLRTERDTLARQLAKVDECLGFPDGNGSGRVEMLTALLSSRDALREALKKLALKWEEAGAFDRVRLGDKGVAIQATYCDCADDLNQLLAETPTETTL